MTDFDVVVIGSGPAGYTAALYAARYGLKVLLSTGANIGGQLIQTTEVHNFPSYEAIDGFTLMGKMLDQVKTYPEVKILEGVSVTDTTHDGETFSVRLDDGSQVSSRTVILATGSKAKWLGNEGELKGRGISTCATCDGFFHRKKAVVVIGGGDTALEEATYLAGICSHVTLIHRRAELRASKIMQDRFFSKPNVTFLPNVEAKKFDKLERGVLVTLSDGFRLDVSGVFVAIGHEPVTSPIKTLIDNGFVFVDSHGYVSVADGTMTDLPGLFVAGDVSDSVYRQAITAAGTGCMAAIDAFRWLQHRG